MDDKWVTRKISSVFNLLAFRPKTNMKYVNIAVENCEVKLIPILVVYIVNLYNTLPLYKGTNKIILHIKQCLFYIKHKPSDTFISNSYLHKTHKKSQMWP